MDVSDICRREIVSLSGNSSVQAAAQTMRREHVGTVVVTDPDEPGRVMGLLTDRDLVIDVLAAGRSAAEPNIGALCHSDLVGVRANANVHEAVEAMRGSAVRRLFVMQPDGGVVGLLSMDDVVEALAAEFGGVAVTLREGIERERERTEGTAAEPGPQALYLRH